MRILERGPCTGGITKQVWVLGTLGPSRSAIGTPFGMGPGGVLQTSFADLLNPCTFSARDAGQWASHQPHPQRPKDVKALVDGRQKNSNPKMYDRVRKRLIGEVHGIRILRTPLLRRKLGEEISLLFEWYKRDKISFLIPKEGTKSRCGQDIDRYRKRGSEYLEKWVCD